MCLHGETPKDYPVTTDYTRERLQKAIDTARAEVSRASREDGISVTLNSTMDIIASAESYLNGQPVMSFETLEWLTDTLEKRS